MSDEEEDDIPEWEIEPEKVSDSLKEKWRKREEKGLRAALCPACRKAFTTEDLVCPHCGAPVEIPSARDKTLRNWLLKSWLGLSTFLLILASVILYLVQ